LSLYLTLLHCMHALYCNCVCILPVFFLRHAPHAIYLWPFWAEYKYARSTGWPMSERWSPDRWRSWRRCQSSRDNYIWTYISFLVVLGGVWCVKHGKTDHVSIFSRQKLIKVSFFPAKNTIFWYFLGSFLIFKFHFWRENIDTWSVFHVFISNTLKRA